MCGEPTPLPRNQVCIFDVDHAGKHSWEYTGG